jgi:hypothetical protein
MKLVVILLGVIANVLGATAAIWLGVLVVQGVAGR